MDTIQIKILKLLVAWTFFSERDNQSMIYLQDSRKMERKELIWK